MFNRVLAIARKEMLHIRRDRRVMAAILFMPLVQLLLFSFALSLDVKDIGLAVLDNDRSAESRRLIGAFTNSGYFKIQRLLTGHKEIGATLDSGAAKAVLVVPPDFSRRLAGDRKTAVQVLIDGSESNAATFARNYATVIVQRFSRDVQMTALARHGLGNSAAAKPVEARSRVWYNPDARSTIFILPGLIVLIMASIAIQQTALAVVREKDHGTIEQLIVSPMHPFELMIGKILPFVAMACFDLVVIMLIGVWGFGLPIRGSLGVLALGSALFTIAALGLGLFVSSVSSTMETASQLSQMLAMLPTFLLSGFVWPLEGMPGYLQVLSYFFPARYFVSFLRSLFLKGTGIDMLWPELLALALFALVSVTLAARNVKERTG